MALRLNLYHEIARERLQRRRDPLKILLIFACVIAAGLMFYYVARYHQVRLVSNRLAGVRAEWAATEPKEKEAKEQEAIFTAQLSKRDLITRRIESRFYWAPVLEEIVRTVPREAQLLRMEAELSKDRPGTCLITLTGVAAGAEPRAAAEELRTRLADAMGARFKKASAVFKFLEDSTEPAQVEGRLLATANSAILIDVGVPETAPAPASTPAAPAATPPPVGAPQEKLL
jgi:hypothetical protein